MTCLHSADTWRCSVECFSHLGCHVAVYGCCILLQGAGVAAAVGSRRVGLCYLPRYGKLMHLIGWRDFCFDPYHVDLIATTLSSQFMIHIKTSIYIGLLCASPYILYELFRFVLPALQETEKRYSVQIVITVYALFVLGVLMSYFLLFPISFRFLGTYSVASQIHSTITIDSYISTFVTLTFLMGVVFQLPVIAFVLGKIGIIDSAFLARYRKHSFWRLWLWRL